MCMFLEMGVPLVIIHFRLEFSMKSTIQASGAASASTRREILGLAGRVVG